MKANKPRCLFSGRRIQWCFQCKAGEKRDAFQMTSHEYTSRSKQTGRQVTKSTERHSHCGFRVVSVSRSWTTNCGKKVTPFLTASI